MSDVQETSGDRQETEAWEGPTAEAAAPAKQPPTARTCPRCSRAFFPTAARGCHCVADCCRADSCQNRGVPVSMYTESRRLAKKCCVCRTPGGNFQPFAPCDRNCKRTFFGSSRGDTKFGGNYSRRWLCKGLIPGLERHHRPTKKPRIHIKYCSLRCYNSISWGHDTRRLQGERGRRYKQREYRNWKRRLEAGDRRWMPNRTRYIGHVGPPRPL